MTSLGQRLCKVRTSAKRVSEDRARTPTLGGAANQSQMPQLLRCLGIANGTVHDRTNMLRGACLDELPGFQDLRDRDCRCVHDDGVPPDGYDDVDSTRAFAARGQKHAPLPHRLQPVHRYSKRKACQWQRSYRYTRASARRGAWQLSAVCWRGGPGRRSRVSTDNAVHCNGVVPNVPKPTQAGVYATASPSEAGPPQPSHHVLAGRPTTRPTVRPAAGHDESESDKDHERRDGHASEVVERHAYETLLKSDEQRKQEAAEKRAIEREEKQTAKIAERGRLALEKSRGVREPDKGAGAIAANGIGKIGKIPVSSKAAKFN